MNLSSIFKSCSFGSWLCIDLRQIDGPMDRQIDLPRLDDLNSSKSQGHDFAFQTALKGRNNAAPYKGRDSAGRRAGYEKHKAQHPEALSFEKAMIKHDGVCTNLNHWILYHDLRQIDLPRHPVLICLEFFKTSRLLTQVNEYFHSGLSEIRCEHCG